MYFFFCLIFKIERRFIMVFCGIEVVVRRVLRGFYLLDKGDVRVYCIR